MCGLATVNGLFSMSVSLVSTLPRRIVFTGADASSVATGASLTAVM